MPKTLFQEVDITEPLEGRVIIKRSWWVCIAGDNRRALYYGNSPQCNKNSAIAKRLIQTALYKNLEVEAVYVDTAFALRRD